METIAMVFGMTFIGVIVICLIWTILSYISEAYAPNNKLEDNIKKYDEQQYERNRH
tara:strand:- start:238 stop:405 length:168 start_codon:yes stop_codon:yes gene_type:complete